MFQPSSKTIITLVRYDEIGWLLVRSATFFTENLVVTSECAKHNKKTKSVKLGQGVLVGQQKPEIFLIDFDILG